MCDVCRCMYVCVCLSKVIFMSSWLLYFRKLSVNIAYGFIIASGGDRCDVCLRNGVVEQTRPIITVVPQTRIIANG